MPLLAPFKNITRHAKTITAILTLITLCLAQTVQAEKIKMPKLPDSLGKDGLVMMQLGSFDWHKAVVKLNKGNRATAVDGYFALKLAPGTYKVKNVSVTTSLVSKTTEKLEMDLEFEVKPGKVTSLGLQYLLADPGNTGRHTYGTRQYVVVALRNPGSERAWLQHYYPRLAASLADDAIEMAPLDYKNDNLPEIRKMLISYYAKKAYQTMENGGTRVGFSKWPIAVTNSMVVVGDLGLVAYSNGNELEIADTGTLDPIDQVQNSGDAPWFFSRSGHLYRLQGKTLETLPRQSFYPYSATRWGDGIVLADRHLRLRVSTDAGASWSQNDAAAFADNVSLKSDFVAGVDRLFVLAQDPKRVFRLIPHAVLQSDNRTVSWKLPKDLLKNFQGLLENEAGLFVHTQDFQKPGYIHFKAAGSDQWRKSLITNEHHCYVSFADASRSTLAARCGSLTFVSGDNGQTWASKSVAAAR